MPDILLTLFELKYTMDENKYEDVSRPEKRLVAIQPVLCVELLNREMRGRRREKQSSCFDRWCIVVSFFLHNWYFRANVF